MKHILFIIMLLPMLLQAQQHTSCPVGHHHEVVYENPLYEQYLSRYDVKFYYLSLEVSNTDTEVDGFTTIGTVAVAPMDTIVFQLIDSLEITSISVNDQIVPEYNRREDAVFVPVDAGIGQQVNVTIHYNGDAGQNRGFFAGMTSAYDQANNQWVTYTLSEPLNARDWFPVKQVLSDKADSVWVDLIVDRELMAGSNGLLEEIEDLGGGKHMFKWRSRYPIAYYLISLAVADYRDYSFKAPLSNPNDSVLVQNYIYDDDNYFQRWKEDIDATGDMITLFSDLVLDYPFAAEKYGHTVAPMGGGMEHQTMTTLSNFGFNLVAHELAHQWFGDNVTCGNWQDIWINEGFASYFEYVARQYLLSQEAANGWMETAMAAAFEETESVYVPEEEADNVYRVFDYGLSYKKGAVLLHMIRYEMNNDSLFFGMLKEYSERYTDSVATAVEFREVLEEVSGMDFSCFFDQWYYGKGYPSYNLVGSMKGDTLYVKSLQEASSQETPLFKMHFDLLISTSEGDQVVRLYQEQTEQEFAIPVQGYVNNIQFDPDKFLLAKSFSEIQFPEGKDFIIGPNPFSDRITLRFRNMVGGEDLRIFTLDGKLVKETIISESPFEMDFSGIADGTYMLIINGPSGQIREKIIKAQSN